jgi:hypothetical protein
MFPSKFPVPVLLHMVGIIAAVLAVVLYLGNPLGLFGLMLMPSVPIMSNDEGDDLLVDADGSAAPVGFIDTNE